MLASPYVQNLAYYKQLKPRNQTLFEFLYDSLLKTMQKCLSYRIHQYLCTLNIINRIKQEHSYEEMTDDECSILREVLNELESTFPKD